MAPHCALSTYWIQIAFLIVSISPLLLHYSCRLADYFGNRTPRTHHIKVKVRDLALTVASKCQTVGEGTDTIFSSVERLLSVMREGGFGVLYGGRGQRTHVVVFP